ncbi:MAG: hypothetical protein FJ098_17305, partial [Deltaproteobacteria bacterium]|nr:hypothetical protein [Deltaproteobacteria bacterium]
MKPVVRFAAVLVLVSSGALAARAGVSPERTFLICQASGVTTEEDARPYVDGFGKYLAGKLGWSPDSWEVRFETGSCLKVLDTWKPAYATIPLGDFLAAETRLSMIPLVLAKVAGKSTGRYRILVKKGAYGSLDALKGKILLGNLVGDAAFLSRVILKGALDAATHFVLQQMSRPLKAIRDVAKGKADAVLVDDLQYDSLKQLSVFPDLQVVFTS